MKLWIARDKDGVLILSNRLFCDDTCYSMPDWCRMIEGDDRIYFKKIEEEL